MARSALAPVLRIRPLVRVIEPSGTLLYLPPKATPPITDKYARFRIYYAHWSLNPQ